MLRPPGQRLSGPARHGDDAIDFAADKNRYIGAVSALFGADGKRLRPKVSGKTKQEVRLGARPLRKLSAADVRSALSALGEQLSTRYRADC